MHFWERGKGRWGLGHQWRSLRKGMEGLLGEGSAMVGTGVQSRHHLHLGRPWFQAPLCDRAGEQLPCSIRAWESEG